MTADRPLDIYLVAIGGTGMAPLACLLQELGHRVRGADGPLYPPMSEVLAAAGIEPMKGFDPAHLVPPPELVVIGNAVPRTNPEAVAVDAAGIPRISMPQALARFCLAGRDPLVVAGTHGKTTTTALAAWVLSQAGEDPGYLVGGVPLGRPAGHRLGCGRRFVVEGDEYNAAYFDRGPKFLHYRPETLVLTSADYDHADLYPSHQALLEAYRGLLDTLPPKGRLLACGDDPLVRALAAGAPCRVDFYGLGDENSVRPVTPVTEGPEGSRCRVRAPGGVEVELEIGVPGRHNLSNALAAWAAAVGDGVDPERAAAAVATFRGVRRRLEELGTAAGVSVIDDFAHHPRAVAASLGALRRRYPGRRLVAIFEPRSLTAGRALFFDAYLEAFTGADRALLAPVYHHDRLAPEDTLDRARLVAELASRGVEAEAFDTIPGLERAALAGLATGDVAVTMSSGAFEGLPYRLLEALQAASDRTGGA